LADKKRVRRQTRFSVLSYLKIKKKSLREKMEKCCATNIGANGTAMISLRKNPQDSFRRRTKIAKVLGISARKFRRNEL